MQSFSFNNCASQDSDDGSIHPASLTSTQKTDTSQAGSIYQQPDVGDEDLIGDESEEEEEEIVDAKLFLVRKENCGSFCQSVKNLAVQSSARSNLTTKAMSYIFVGLN